MNDFENAVIQQLEKAEQIFSEVINNHLTTNKNLIDAKKKLDVQERMISMNQAQILEQSRKISANEEKILEQSRKISAYEEKILEQSCKLAAQAAKIDEQDYELSLHREKLQDLLQKVVKLEQNGSSNIFKTITIVIAVAAVTTLVKKYI
jgi:uncharacterized protein (DUF3084 family)